MRKTQKLLYKWISKIFQMLILGYEEVKYLELAAFLDKVFLVVMYGCESWTIKKAEC